MHFLIVDDIYKDLITSLDFNAEGSRIAMFDAEGLLSVSEVDSGVHLIEVKLKQELCMFPPRFR